MLMKVVVELFNGSTLVLEKVAARHISEIEKTFSEETEEYSELEIRNTESPQRRISFYLSDVRSYRFENQS